MKFFTCAAMIGIVATTVSAGAQTADKGTADKGTAGKGADHQFVEKAAEAGMAEVEAGQLAQKHAARDEVRQFGQQMVTDHTKANQQLMQIAQQKGITPPAKSRKAQVEGRKLESLTGAAFDKEYMTAQVADHQQAVALFEKEANSGSDPDLKKFAGDTLPILRQHQDMAHKVMSEVGSVNAAASGGTGPQ